MMPALIERELRGLEVSVADAERAIAENDAEAAETSFADQRRIQHALENAMHDARALRTPESDRAVLDRLSLIGIARDRQIATLKKVRAELSAKINTLNTWKRASRRWLSGFEGKRNGRLDQSR